MRRKTLGRPDVCDLAVSVVGLGCNNFGRRIGADESIAVVHAALDAGITLFDTADIYGDGQSEDYIGRALGARRKDVVIATKFGFFRGGSAAHVAEAAEASLKRLRTDWIDLFQLHSPDRSTPIEETLTALDRLVRAGKVRWIGCSNFDAPGLAAALAASEAGGLARFVTAQNRYSLLDREIEAELLPFCEREGIGVLPYYPLASGLLTGKYRRGRPAPTGSRLARGGTPGGRLDDRSFDAIEPLAAYAAAQGRELIDLAISWLAARPGIPSVIAGATTPEQVARNARAADWQMTSADLAAIDKILDGAAARR